MGGRGAVHGCPVCPAPSSGAPTTPVTVTALAFLAVLHPVGPLPAAVYWRRRALVLLLLLSLVGGGGWLAVVGVGRWRASTATDPAAATRTLSTPALEQVLPSLPAARPPTAGQPAVSTAAAGLSTSPVTPCTDAMIGLVVRAPGSAVAGRAAALQLVVTNTSPVACARDLAAGQQEIALVGAGGTQLWSSADCLPDPSGDVRTLLPGAAVSLAVAWDGLTSDPTCAGPRVTPPKGQYVLRGRLGTKQAADVPLTVT